MTGLRIHYSLVNKLQIDLRFINRYRDTWPAALTCMSSGILNLKPLVTHAFALENGMKRSTCVRIS